MVMPNDQLKRAVAARSDAPGRNAVSQEAATKKAPARKAIAKKATPQKAPAKKTAARKVAAKKAPGEKAPAKKAPAKKAPAKTGPAKKVAAKKGPVETAAAKKAPAEKAAAKKAPGKRTAPKKAPGKKAPAGKAPEERAPVENRPGAVGPETGADLAERAPTLMVRADEEPWSKAELEELYLQLQAEADRLRTELDSAAVELADLLRDSGDGAGDDQADAGSRTFEREHEMSLAANTRDMLEQTERAMGRIRNGTYGVCEGCGNPIGKARLLAFPRATLCVSCKQREERR